MAYTIIFAQSVKEQLKWFTARQSSLIFDSIEKQLLHEPLTETKNSKPLRPNPIAPWELRIDNLRVFYDVPIEESNTVYILAVGLKKGNKLYIAGKEIEL